MKTAYILTQPLGMNYGAILQNYALQNVLRRFGCEPVNIEFAPGKSLKRTVIELVLLNHFTIDATCRFFSAFLKRFVPRIFYSKMELFVKDRISFINIPKDASAIKNAIAQAKDPVIVVGSDQVWRPKFSPHLPFYFCSFLDNGTACRHFSYAASFGVDFWEYTREETDMAKKLIAGFDAVSVREKTAIGLCRDYLGYPEAAWVPDPTLLLTRDDYLKISRKKTGSEPFVMTYFLRPTEAKEKMVDAVSSSLNLKRVDFSPRLQTGPLRSPEEWLACIRDAAYVLTDSFHGTVFSLIFHKQFALLHNDFGGDTRLKEILDLFQIGERLFDDDDTRGILNALDTPIDYAEIDAGLESFRKKGFDFLNEQLS